MKLKINKVCDLSSISVLPPHSRRANIVPSGPDSSVFGKSQASQLRSQQSQQSFSQGFSSQLGLSSLSQNSLDEIVANEQRFCSQERENLVKRNSCLAPITCTREESQVPMSRSSTNLIRKWSSASVPDHRCQVSEELEHRIGLMETSLNRWGMFLDSIQSDVMQVNKGIKEVSLEMEGIRKKLIAHDDSLQLMTFLHELRYGNQLKGDEDIKVSVNESLKSMSDQLNKDSYQDKLQETVSELSALPGRIEARLLKLQNELYGTFTKEIEAMVSSIKPPNQKHLVPTILPPKRRGSCATQSQKEQQPVTKKKTVPPKVYTRATRIPKIETGSWNSLKLEPATFTDREPNMEHGHEEILLTGRGREWRVIIESDEEIDGAFSCLL